MKFTKYMDNALKIAVSEFARDSEEKERLMKTVTMESMVIRPIGFLNQLAAKAAQKAKEQADYYEALNRKHHDR